MTNNSKVLTDKYRPSDWKDVVGQDLQVKSLRNALSRNSNHTYLFTGPSGTGKTTLARLAAKEVNVSAYELVEIDAASKTGIDDIREVLESNLYRPMGGGNKAIILDECFVAGANVDTPNGPVDIKDIVVGDVVSTIEGRSATVSRVFTNRVPVDRLVRVTIGARSFYCTRDHDFLTSSGWRGVGELNGREIKTKTSKESEVYLYTLWEKLRWCRIECEVLQQLQKEELRSLWKSICGKKSHQYTNLFKSLWLYIGRFQESWNKTFLCWGEDIKFFKAFVFGKSRVLEETLCPTFLSYDTSKSCFTEGCTGADQAHQRRTRYSTQAIYSSWREWEGVDRSSSFTTLFGRWGMRVCSRYWAEGKWLSFTLQVGYRLFQAEIRRRIRWAQPQQSESPSAGQEEGSYTATIRVENLTIEEQDSFTRNGQSCSRDTGFVTCYDLEIEHTHVYSVEGCLVHNCHALSKSAIQALLKATEEPPDWLYWFLCTTEPGRVIKTLQTRCFRCDLKPVKSKDLQRLLLDICKNEKIKLSTDIVDLCVQGSDGSPRQAIANLAVCSVATSMEEAEELLQKEVEASEAIDLARLLVKRVSWRELQGCLQKLKDNNPESVRHIVRAYLTTVVLNAKNEDSAGACLEILDCFSQPFNSADGISPLVLACGKAVLS